MNRYKFVLGALLAALFLVSPGFSQTYRETRITRTTTTTTLPDNTLSPMISSVTFDITRHYAAGDTLQVTLRGEPGAAATFDVGTLATGVPMNEVSPGVYVGTYTLPPGISAATLRITGRLSKGTTFDFKTAPYMLSLLPAGQAIVTELHPQNGSYVTTDPPYALVRFNHDVDIAAKERMRAYLDKQDITRDVTVTPNYLAYAPVKNFSLGYHALKVVSYDNAGGRFEQNLLFKVEAEPVAQFIPVPSQSLMTSVKIFDNASSPARSGDIVKVTMIGRPGGIATFDVAAGPTTSVAYSAVPYLYASPLYAVDEYTPSMYAHRTTVNNEAYTVNQGSGAVSTTTTTTTAYPSYVSGAPVPNQTYQPTGNDELGIPMKEINPGTYVGVYTVNNADFFNNAVITGNLTLPDGGKLVGFAPTVTDFSYYTAQMILPGQTSAAVPAPVSGAPAANY